MHAVGVDIGGTKIAAGVVDEDGHILARTRRDTDPQDPASIELAVADVYRELAADHEIGSLGVAAAAYIDADCSTVVFAPNISWRNRPLRENVSALIGHAVPVVLENDANAAGWAEYRYGAAAGVRNFLLLTVGTGLGGAMVVNDQLIRGHSGFGAEVGHMRVVPDGLLCGCGLHGCWEQYASGSALTREARAAVLADPVRGAALLTAAGGDVDAIRGPLIDTVAFAGDELAVELLAQLGRWIGAGSASYCALLDPELIVIGGGVSHAGDLLLDPAREALVTHLTGRAYREPAPMVVATLGNEAGIVGAADLSRS